MVGEKLFRQHVSRVMVRPRGVAARVRSFAPKMLTAAASKSGWRSNSSIVERRRAACDSGGLKDNVRLVIEDRGNDLGPSREGRD